MVERHDYLVLETSSHSLDQHRVWGVDYDIAVITNVTREHLDYHKTMEKYRKAKKKLFENAEKIVVNMDMEKPEEFLGVSAKEKWGYCVEMQSANLKMENRKWEVKDKEIKVIKAENVELSIGQSKYQIQNTKYQLNLPGSFNIENALAATCTGLALGVRKDVIVNALKEIEEVPGRMENVPNDKNLNIIIDYAVTPDSLQKLYELIEESKENNSKVISVFGSCGERDRGKRPIMGEIVSKFADYVIITNEDPYNEDPHRIIEEVASGVKNKREGSDFWKIFDRREAIRKALELANPQDVIVITGKGAEETMAVGKERIPWNDKMVVLEELERVWDEL